MLDRIASSPYHYSRSLPETSILTIPLQKPARTLNPDQDPTPIPKASQNPASSPYTPIPETSKNPASPPFPYSRSVSDLESSPTPIPEAPRTLHPHPTAIPEAFKNRASSPNLLSRSLPEPYILPYSRSLTEPFILTLSLVLFQGSHHADEGMSRTEICKERVAGGAL